MWNTAAEKTQTQRIIFKKNNNNCSRNNSTVLRDERWGWCTSFNLALCTQIRTSHMQQTQWKQSSGFIKCHSRCLIWSFLSISSFYSLADFGMCMCMCNAFNIVQPFISYSTTHPSIHLFIHFIEYIIKCSRSIYYQPSSFLLRKRKSNAYNRHCRFDISHFILCLLCICA